MLNVTSIRSLLFATAALLVASQPAGAGSIALRWDAVPGAAGYKIYAGANSGQYNRVVDVGNTTNYTLQNVANCSDQFIAVKAYNSQLQESEDFSNEISGWPRPAFAGMGAVRPMQGQQFTLGINGANFQPGSQINFDLSEIPHDMDDDPLIRIDSATVVACDRIEALITVESAARGFRAMEVGTYTLDFEVRGGDAVFGAGSRDVVVEYNPARTDVNRSDNATRDRVDGKDLVWLAYAYATVEGQTYFNPDADLNGDGQVDGVDLSLLASDFGRCWSAGSWSKSACP